MFYRLLLWIHVHEKHLCVISDSALKWQINQFQTNSTVCSSSQQQSSLSVTRTKSSMPSHPPAVITAALCVLASLRFLYPVSN